MIFGGKVCIAIYFQGKFAVQTHGALILCFALLWRNAEIAPQNNGDVVLGKKTKHKISSYFGLGQILFGFRPRP